MKSLLAEGIIDNEANEGVISALRSSGRELLLLPELTFSFQPDQQKTFFEAAKTAEWLVFAEPFGLESILVSGVGAFDLDSVVVVAVTEGIAVTIREMFVHTDIVVEDLLDVEHQLNRYEAGLGSKPGIVIGSPNESPSSFSIRAESQDQFGMAKWEALGLSCDAIHLCTVEDVFTVDRFEHLKNLPKIPHGSAAFSTKK